MVDIGAATRVGCASTMGDHSKKANNAVVDILGGKKKNVLCTQGLF